MDSAPKPVLGKRPPGRPAVHPIPRPIPDTAENIARALLRTPPKTRGEWKYLKAAQKRA
ncbi:MAG: hypothetical protein OXE57_20360 [Alphaproteobacteria bacterium]|nr:hypothetical protein [Alphaproteobacteria bacterium]